MIPRKRDVLTLAVLAAFMSSPAVAADHGIRLEPFPKTGGGLTVRNVKNYYGTCGFAGVEISGVESENDDFFSFDTESDSAMVVVRVAGRARRITADNGLSDYNAVACVTQGRKKYVVIGSACGGSSCGGWDFTVIDVAPPRIIAGAGGKSCDARCAARITGNSFPIKLAQEY